MGVRSRPRLSGIAADLPILSEIGEPPATLIRREKEASPFVQARFQKST